MSDIGERMKLYECLGAASEQMMPRLPIIIRLDGRAFHSFTRKMKRPFDLGLHSLMDTVTSWLVLETGAIIGYTQSDEITLILYSDKPGSQVFFDGHRDKLNSILAAMASVKFNAIMFDHLDDWPADAMPVFDCRCFTVPSRSEAVNALLWRELDATRNAVMMLAQSKFSHKQLLNRSGSEMQEMLFSQHGINFNDLDPGIKRGRYFRRQLEDFSYTDEQREKLPANHHAKPDPDASYQRGVVRRLELPMLTKIPNREEVVFDGADPVECLAEV